MHKLRADFDWQGRLLNGFQGLSKDTQFVGPID